jgi:hypothetical protein
VHVQAARAEVFDEPADERQLRDVEFARLGRLDLVARVLGEETECGDRAVTSAGNTRAG